jgi:SAM-dependent methyltransferase
MDMTSSRKRLTYETLEPLAIDRPVDRLTLIEEICRGKRVLDLGCLDETALVKRDTRHWLHGRISRVAAKVVGVDMSALVPDEGLVTGPISTIYKGDATDPTIPVKDADIDVIVAGEFIEHIESPLSFFRTMKRRFPGRELIVSTPNGLAFANTMLGAIRREAQHPDHIHVFTFKILNTIADRAALEDWEIVPYRFYATEMIMNSAGAKRALTIIAERVIRLVERMFPLLSFGYVVRARL